MRIVCLILILMIGLLPSCNVDCGGSIDGEYISQDNQSRWEFFNGDGTITIGGTETTFQYVEGCGEISINGGEYKSYSFDGDLMYLETYSFVFKRIQ